MFGLDIFHKIREFNNRKEEDGLKIFFTEGDVVMAEKVKNIEDYLGINTKLSIRINREDYPDEYESRVEDITKKYILISHPSSDGIPIPMLPGTRVKLDYVSGEGRFSFNSEVVGKHTENSLSFIQVAIPKEISRNQLREFFRVPTNIKGKVKVFYAKVPDMSMKIPHKKVDCKVVDLSGGGGKLISDAFFDKGQVFGLDMSEEIEGADNVLCTCIRSKRIQEKSEVSFKFNMDKESERNLIIKYVFKRQIELKQLFG